VPDRRRTTEWWCRLILRVLAASFALVGSLFLFCPDATIGTMNAVGASLGHFTPAPPSALRFWLSLGTGYMVLVTALAYLAQRDLQRHRTLLALLALGKATSSLTCLAFYVFSVNAFIYLANCLVDGTIALTAAVIWVIVPGLSEPTVAEKGLSENGAERVFGAIVESMIPAGGSFPEGARDVLLLRDLESFVAGSASLAPRMLRLGLRLFDVSPYILPPLRLRRFSHLSPEERVRLLETWEQSRLLPRRQAMHLLKLLVMTHFYSRPEVAERLGYPHPLERVPRPQGKAA
jgi:hypothetical protein